MSMKNNQSPMMAKQVHQMKLDPLEMKNTNGFESDATGHIDEG
jgi:hypothetical protein